MGKKNKGGAGGNKKGDKDDEGLTRIAILSQEKCKPKKCRQECKKSCPVVKMGKMCIEVTNTSKLAFISEPLCIGCGICTKKCPFEAIHIINLPKDLSRNTTHRYGPNSFKLHRLPMPRPGQVGLGGMIFICLNLCLFVCIFVYFMSSFICSVKLGVVNISV